ncbi:WD40-like Beta Propeller Repeat [Tangfeifania diversioriginum]|uniref:WD40-like Beta Propeller Repeat n=1 Tax=Tangfeifania diversioriginum TaxID=1168035 RepID=A0A1M6C5N0_9BACT|nr:PD40 domain-containing protein [Tangfeifania diversioriginum]SHI56319.1 WD40-like Beta Propeller Repeat [Tangfeifania diversioriginum]
MPTQKRFLFFLNILLITFITGCKSPQIGEVQKANQLPKIFPNYINVTIPVNIAPMNFSIKEEGDLFWAKISSGNEELLIRSKNGVIKFQEKRWKKLIKNNQEGQLKIKIFVKKEENEITREFEPFHMYIAKEKIDPFLVYRLIHPGYYNWSSIKIEQRSVESFNQASIVENELIEKNCVNCHAFNQNNPERFLIHIRGSKGGTYFTDDQQILKTDLKIESMPGGATYPSWHPGGRFVAFSSNQVRQNFYAHQEKSIEVFDLVSSLILYDTQTNEILNITEKDSINPLQTFPSWSPDGKYLYFCSAGCRKAGSNLSLDDIKNIHYNLVRKSFDPISRTFGKDELVFDASKMKKSASFPRISPDGKFIVFTMADYGTFPIWHEEADLYLLNLQSGKFKKMELNSNKTESYHTWSSNGKWLVFSSKRIDGRSARPHFAYINSGDSIGKPFVLPQQNPNFYNKILESYNIPEFVTSKVKFNPTDFESAANKKPLISSPGNPNDTTPRWIKLENEKERAKIEKGVHE